MAHTQQIAKLEGTLSAQSPSVPLASAKQPPDAVTAFPQHFLTMPNKLRHYS